MFYIVASTRMIVTKVIEVGLDIHNCINLYTDPNNILLILADHYEGRCFKGCYIVKIEKIRKLGECMINQDGVPDFGTISVIFEATVVMYAIGEIINGCKVLNRDEKGILTCSTGIADIMISPGPILESVTKGQIISIRVAGARYNGASTKIAVMGLPFVPQRSVTYYKVSTITPTVRTHILSILSDVVERCNYELTELEKLRVAGKDKAWSTFNQLIYAYKEEKPQPAESLMIDINDLLDGSETLGKVKFMCRDAGIKPTTPDVYGYSNSNDLPTDAIVRYDTPLINVLLMYFEDYCAQLRTVREMVEIYNTEKLLLDHKNIWMIFKKNKL